MANPRSSPPGGDVGWTGALALIDALKAMDAPLRGRLRAAFDRHDAALKEVDGDPLREEWTKFRPLRLSREEDWSDWLAWLVENSKSNWFAELLFGSEAEAWVRTSVTREERLDPYRVDVRIEWRNTNAGVRPASTVIEVKTGDRQFGKTKFAAEAHHRAFPEAQCKDWILVPPEDREACAVPGVQTLTWDKVALALRRSLRNRSESISWRVWARTFLGAIEQSLLGFPHQAQFDTALDVTACLQHLEESHGEGN